jgi:DNA invertase Pin-like site-specific DNA recombinase
VAAEAAGLASEVMVQEQPGRVLVAQYLRMSTERQDYSIELQSGVNAAYAARNGYLIVRTYADEGISGLGIEKRAGLQSLIADVTGGRAKFTVILVYDVSRWGRFQDPDQAAHYEFLCRDAGVDVEYCAEPFPNDGSLSAALLKSMKRLMAAEFSRELSAKTRTAKHGLRELGYWQGGSPGYALRRQVVTRAGKVLRTCEYGENSGQKGARTVVVWGPPAEIAVVRRIYRMFIRERALLVEIARELESEGLTADGGRPWRWWIVRQILTNEKYAGTFVLGQGSQILGVRQRTDPSEWRRMSDRIKPMVSRVTFRAAQTELAHRRRGPASSELLAELQDLLATHGYLTAELIDTYASQTSDYFRRRFGDLFSLYRLVGYDASPRQVRMRELMECVNSTKRGSGHILSDDQLLDQVRVALARAGRLSHSVLRATPGMPSGATLRRRFGSFKNLYELVGYVPTARQKQQFETLHRFASPRP